jgi:hypothetical protein
MTRLVVLPPTPVDRWSGYDLRIGPLAFDCPTGPVGETLGDGLEAVGAALTPAERRPRPIKLPLTIRARRDELDPTAVGLRMRRQVRQVLENERLRGQGLYLYWRADEELSGWLRLGGGDVTETDPGLTFGDFELELDSPYLVGRPGTHRMGRRLDLGDRRTGLVPRDTRGTLYSTDFATAAIPAEPIVVPGDVVAFVASGNRPVASSTSGPLRGARRLWRTVSGSNGEVISYLPDVALLPNPARAPLDLEEPGIVRVWDLANAVPSPPDPALYTPERDTDPDVYNRWERVLGDVLAPAHPLAVDNGVCRLVWLGPSAAQGLALEWWDDALGHYRREGRILHATGVSELRVVEATGERAVLELRAGELTLRAILQRGWNGARLESYNDGGGTARLEYAPDAGAPTVTPDATLPWVQTIAAGGRSVYWAQGTADETRDTTPGVITGPAASYRRNRTIVAQIGTPASSAATAGARSLVDAQSVPVLLGRR